jgi:hypothetical protein
LKAASVKNGKAKKGRGPRGEKKVMKGEKVNRGKA